MITKGEQREARPATQEVHRPKQAEGLQCSVAVIRHLCVCAFEIGWNPSISDTMSALFEAGMTFICEEDHRSSQKQAGKTCHEKAKRPSEKHIGSI